LGFLLSGVEKSIHTPEHEELTTLLRQLRLDAGLNQADLAERLGVNQTWVSKYEVGERRLDLVQLRLVCQALGVSVSDLVKRWDSGLRRRSR
jgi:transcriptional regulator with XRE-family HTH domain